MNLINKKLLQQRLHSFEFPNPEKLTQSKQLLERWVKALKDSDLEGTKEKSVQGKFLSTFFEDILGYSDVTTGNEEWTLIQHPRIENDSKEPDGSLGWFTKDRKVTRAVIELKDAKAQLDRKQNRGSEKLTPIEQAYLYATKYEGCNWIIVSNFKEIRLYNKHRTQEYYEKFDVIDLVQDAELKRFYFLLSKENLISKEKESVIDILAKDTTEAEQDITKKFYSEFREVRLKLLGHLSDNNPQFEKEILLEKTQKLLDRFIFTLFCEDTSTLLPLNLVKNTYERAINSLSPSDERVWTEFKGLFLAIDKGNDRVKPPINAYNGGLFAFDEILDTLSIKDDFWANLMHLTEYDFETDLNVNILGHIFEQSISDLESLKSELRGEEQDKKKSKRKKDGIFYTPEYITRYIVENTVGKYLEEHPDRLETIKILDPACGSGAFLNQAHSHLVQEYTNRYESMINEKLEKGESITLFDYNPAENNRNILLNNLYGVDLNRESVEITKLALWLKTARVTEPLQNLDKNIKAGNSLIDAPEIAGKKAFNWNNEFNEIMENGGFDVIIGNPPYVGIKAQRKEDRDYLKKRYELSGGADLYVTFIEKSLSLLKDGGYLSFICPNKFFGADYGRKIRKYLNESPDFQILSIWDLKDEKVFEDAQISTIVITIKKTSEKVLPLLKKGIFTEEVTSFFDDNGKIQIEQNEQSRRIIEKIEKIKRLNEIADIRTGIMGFEYWAMQPIITNLQDDNSVKLLTNGNFKRYFDKWDTIEIDIFKTKIKTPYIKLDSKFLNENTINLFRRHPKIIVKGVSKQVTGIIDREGMGLLVAVHSIIPHDNSNLEFIVALINSNLINWYHLKSFYSVRIPQGSLKYPISFFSNIPVPNVDDEVKQLIGNKVREIEIIFKQLDRENERVLEFIESQLGLKIKNKSILDLGWNELVEIIEKSKIKLNLDKKEELFTWFKMKQSQLQLLKNRSNSFDLEINQIIYQLFHLTDEEITIIEEKV